MRFPPFYAFFHCLQFAAMISFLRFEISHAQASKVSAIIVAAHFTTAELLPSIHINRISFWSE